ncbi:aminotransferase class V-fold PLP-dependent enzyme [Bradyrhizobium sp. CCGUVB1N3]|uniref:aminotransferase class V-fold PLP-dependent enzyme n=1 Tax=Bradyrhizobium sp. CCGUVB1N3 TaxID=2949629 RepID=UPI0020B2610F|nr:aminotransferase class V-fold PLP-dependent enzyme [Bradyrhizobium sp. CCGUVB1N3]MCP3468753.1 aminotransferase class V-fold PLP-dependent enzyme [Bradyrhizobium sp. CCGUVB1N3]
MIDDQKLSSIRSDLPFLAKGIYVDNASVSPISRRVQIASEQYNNIIAEQLRDARTIAQPHFEKGRALAAKLVGSTAQNIAYVQNTSHGLSLVALGLDWRPGDNLVVCAQEFPSNYLCWTRLAAKGVEVRQISSPDGTLSPDHFRQAMDRRTRLVAVSHVQFFSGFRADLASFRDLCSEYGALLIVDGTQSVGALKLDVEAMGIDVLVASAHKWLMGPRGIGFASFSSRALEAITPAIVGWMSVNDPFEFKRTLDYLPDARRFESGTPNAAGIFGLAERLAEIDELGIEWIEDRVLQLNELLSERALRQSILPVYRFERRSRSGIVLLEKPDIAASSMLAALNKDRIYASIRNGAIRVSMHYYNTVDEVERIICAMNSA